MLPSSECCLRRFSASIMGTLVKSEKTVKLMRMSFDLTQSVAICIGEILRIFHIVLVVNHVQFQKPLVILGGI
jgi:hypothetical protein